VAFFSQISIFCGFYLKRRVAKLRGAGGAQRFVLRVYEPKEAGALSEANPTIICKNSLEAPFRVMFLPNTFKSVLLRALKPFPAIKH
jgi:hypothetical protein